MKTLRQFLEETPTNSISGGFGVRGLGNVTGDPLGDTTAYATNNAAEQGQISSTIQSMMTAHMSASSQTTDGGDQPANIIGAKPNLKVGTANYTGKSTQQKKK